MKLVPTDGILSAIIKAHEVSPEAARTLATFGLFEAMSEQVDAQRHVLEPVMLANMEAIAKKARVALLRDHVGKSLQGEEPEVPLAYAQGLAVLDEYIEKGLTGWLREKFNRDHPRDRAGRFIREDVSSGDPNIKSTAHRRATANVNAVEQATKWRNAGLIDEDTPLHLHVSRLDEQGRQGTEFGQPLRATLKDLRGNPKEGKPPVMESLDPDLVLTGISLHRGDIPANTNAQRAALDVMSTLVGRNDATARRLLRGLPWDEEGKTKSMTEAAERLHAPSGTYGSTDRKAYRQLQATGSTLQRISAPGSTVNTVGGMAQLVGDLGPEAEKILGPGIRRTAYRYRGTERRPDAQVVQQVNAATRIADALADGREFSPDPRAARDNPVLAIATSAGYTSPRLTEDKRALGMRGDAAVAYMLGVGGGIGASHLPSKELTELSLESGEVPPSEGVIIDGNGDMVTQAIGFNGDHYLPFDLKNLHRLFGGQYVRTRAAGGPSTEDLYTGLMTGARQIQVVSNSGVFTVEFDPDLRGGRRFNDKVKRMVSRYGEMLETIAGGTLYQSDLSEDEMARLRQQAAAASSSEEEYKTNLNTLRDRARMQGSLADVDDNELLEAAESHARTQVDREFAERRRTGEMSPAAYRQRIAEVRDEYVRSHGPSVRRLKLDGPGYDRALRALKQEFPYYIREASYQSLPDWLESRGLKNDQSYRRHYAADRGRPDPGQTNPKLPGNNALTQFKDARRRVPTSPSAARRGEEGEQAVQTPQAAQPAAAGARPAAAPAQPKPVADPIAEMKKPGSAYTKAVYNAVRDSALVFKEMDPANGMPPEPANEAEQQRMSSVDFTAWKMRSFTGADPRHGGERFAEWLVNAAPWEQDKVLDSLNGAKAAIRGFEDQVAYDGQTLERGYNALRDLVDLTRPFGEKATEAQTLQQLVVSTDDPKPLAYDDFSVASPPNPAKLVVNEQGIEDFLEGYAGVSPREVAADINRTIAQANQHDEGSPERAAFEKTVRLQHRAWAALTAIETAEKLKKLGVPVGGGEAGPKDQRPVTKADLRPRRQLIFHDLPGTSVVKSHRPPRLDRPSALRLAPQRTGRPRQSA